MNYCLGEIGTNIKKKKKTSQNKSVPKLCVKRNCALILRFRISNFDAPPENNYSKLLQDYSYIKFLCISSKMNKFNDLMCLN